MGRLLHALFYLFIYFVSAYSLNAQETAKGFYQTVDLTPDSKCSCDQKTERHYELYKGVVADDFKGYRMIAYKFSLGSSQSANAKLFHALELDKNVHKVSIHEWDYFMLFVSKDFDAASFESAAKNVLLSIQPVTTEEYLLHKNSGLLELYKSITPTAQ